MRPFRFAVSASHAATAAAWRETARRVEALGYDTLVVTDHLWEQFAPLPALAAALEATTTLRAAPFVLANDYRNPVLLAKEIATLDVLSGGRIELGIGAGWARSDYRQLGIRYDPPAARVERLFEAVGILDRLLRGERVDFAGAHYTVRSAELRPRPVQRPRPPLMIGGGGPRMLRFAARHADTVALLPRMDRRGRPRLTEGTLGATAAKVALIREAAGERLARLDLNMAVFDLGVSDRPRSPLDAAATRLKGLAVGLLETPYVMYGSAEDLRERLLAQRERLGINFYTIPEPAVEAFAPIASALRGA